MLDTRCCAIADLVQLYVLKSELTFDVTLEALETASRQPTERRFAVVRHNRVQQRKRMEQQAGPRVQLVRLSDVSGTRMTELTRSGPSGGGARGAAARREGAAEEYTLAAFQRRQAAFESGEPGSCSQVWSTGNAA